jgi:hypothetical protein
MATELITEAAWNDWQLPLIGKWRVVRRLRSVARKIRAGEIKVVVV